MVAIGVKEHPALMSGEMVRQTLAGFKTMTRRAVGFGIVNEDPDRYKFHGFDDAGRALFEDLRPEITPWITPIKCPYGKTGDLLWVRENWRPFLRGKEDGGYTELIKFAADGAEFPFVFDKDYGELGWHVRPSIHLRKHAARIWLRVTDVRVERLQSISEEDAKAEGVKRGAGGSHFYFYPCKDLRDDSYIADIKPLRGVLQAPSAAQLSFASLWASINGWESWNLNPWVWVISFKIISTTGKPHECARCHQLFERKHDNNFCGSCIEDDREENTGLHEFCPNCGAEYDEIDYEYQICHYCNHNAQEEEE